MPQRFLRPGIRTSERWNAVSFGAQSLYVRLLTLVDDYGRYDGRASVLWGECFAVWNEQNPENAVTLQQVDDMLQQLAAKELIKRYENGRKVVQILQWQERVREGCVSKWPTSEESAASCSELLLPSPSPSPCTIASTPSPLHLRIGGWFRRRSSTAWSEKELKALRVIEQTEPSEDDVAVLESYYTAEFPSDKDYRRRDIITLLNNWPGEIDRAKKWRHETQPKRDSAPGASDYCKMGNRSWHYTQPPTRDQFADDSSFEAHLNHFQRWLRSRHPEIGVAPKTEMPIPGATMAVGGVSASSEGHGGGR